MITVGQWSGVSMSLLSFNVDYNTTVNFGNPVLNDTRNNSGHITHQSVENLTANTVVDIYFLIRDVPGEI